MSNNKLMTGILGVGAVAALVGLYYMAKDDEVEIKYDPKIHTKEKLLEVLNDFELEYASLYLHWYSMMKTKEKELGKGKIPSDTMEAVKQQIQALTGDVDEEIFGNHKISQSTFDEWMEKHKNDPKISQFTKRLNQNFEKLMRVEKPEFNFTYPKELTKQVYLKYIKAAYAKFRYDIYHAVQNKLRQTGAPGVTEEEFNEIIKQCSLPETKIRAYDTMGLPRVPNEQPTKTAMKAYLVLMQEDEAWHKEILNIQKEHKNILFSLTNKGPVEGMHEDPIDVLKREIQYEKQFKNSAPKEEAKVVEVGNGAAKEVTAEEAKKSYGKFSFLGSEDAQKNLVEEFLNRNKKKQEQAEQKEEKVDEVKEEEPKVEEKQDEGEKEVKEEDEQAKQEDNKEEGKDDNEKEDNAEEENTEEVKEASPETENKEAPQEDTPQEEAPVVENPVDDANENTDEQQKEDDKVNDVEEADKVDQTGGDQDPVIADE